MNAFIPFAVVPLILAIGMWIAPWLNNLMLHQPETVQVPQLEKLAAGAAEALLGHAEQDTTPPPRLEVLMPAALMQALFPPPARPPQPSALARYRLKSVLVTPGSRTAVLNDSVVQEGSRLEEFRISRIAADRVVVVGPSGRETLFLDSLDLAAAAVATARGPAPVAEAGSRPVAAAPPRAAQTIASNSPAAELERQYRHLLERLSP